MACKNRHEDLQLKEVKFSLTPEYKLHAASEYNVSTKAFGPLLLRNILMNVTLLIQWQVLQWLRPPSQAQLSITARNS
jgi:hypothetical protein